jgi:hypothetical protein
MQNWHNLSRRYALRLGALAMMMGTVAIPPSRKSRIYDARRYLELAAFVSRKIG